MIIFHFLVFRRGGVLSTYTWCTRRKDICSEHKQHKNKQINEASSLPYTTDDTPEANDATVIQNNTTPQPEKHENTKKISASLVLVIASFITSLFFHIVGVILGIIAIKKSRSDIRKDAADKKCMRGTNAWHYICRCRNIFDRKNNTCLCEQGYIGNAYRDEGI